MREKNVWFKMTRNGTREHYVSFAIMLNHSFSTRLSVVHVQMEKEELLYE